MVHYRYTIQKLSDIVCLGAIDQVCRAGGFSPLLKIMRTFGGTAPFIEHMFG